MLTAGAVPLGSCAVEDEGVKFGLAMVVGEGARRGLVLQRRESCGRCRRWRVSILLVQANWRLRERMTAACSYLTLSVWYWFTITSTARIAIAVTSQSLPPITSRFLRCRGAAAIVHIGRFHVPFAVCRDVFAGVLTPSLPKHGTVRRPLSSPKITEACAVGCRWRKPAR